MTKTLAWLFARATLRLNRRPKFRKWVELEERKETIFTAAEEDADDFPERIYAFLSVALGINSTVLDALYWQDTIALFIKVNQLSVPRLALPLLTSARDKKKRDGKPSWEYPGRAWHFWSHLLAKAYGWSIEYIARLKVEDALARLQEILTDEQLQREFVWTTTEIAYPYNKSTKKSAFKPLPRPYWMLPVAKPVKKVKMLRSFLPIGEIVDVGGTAVINETQS